jgi:hypothetical protein
VSEWVQLALTLAVAVVGSSALTAFITLYFTRPKTTAEAGKLTAEAGKLAAEAHRVDADASKVDAESMALYVAEIREGFNRWKAAMDDWGECVRQKADVEGRLKETEAEKARLGTLAESYRLQVENLQELETDLRGQLREAKKA